MTTETLDASPMRRARVDLSALIHNVATLGLDCVDLSANAYGHGAREVAAACSTAGIANFRVRNEHERDAINDSIQGLRLHLGSDEESVVSQTYGLSEGSSRPVMRLDARILAAKRIRAGEGVSYGYTFRAPSDGWLALMPLGYGDGFVRALGNRGHASWRGQRFPVAGRVAMDVHSVFTHEEEPCAGEDMTYFGAEGLRVADVARLLGAPESSITAALGTRIVREYPR